TDNGHGPAGSGTGGANATGPGAGPGGTTGDTVPCAPSMLAGIAPSRGSLVHPTAVTGFSLGSSNAIHRTSARGVRQPVSSSQGLSAPPPLYRTRRSRRNAMSPSAEMAKGKGPKHATTEMSSMATDAPPPARSNPTARRATALRNVATA